MDANLSRQNNILPDEGKLFSIHAGIKSQTGVLSKWRDDQTEHQGDTHKHRRQNNLKNNNRKNYSNPSNPLEK